MATVVTVLWLRDYEWDFSLGLGDLVVGVGTGLLAWFTYRLAARTKGLAQSAARELEVATSQTAAVRDQTTAVSSQADATRKSLDASIAPWLVLDPATRPAVTVQEPWTKIEVSIVNVGRGLAVVPPSGARVLRQWGADPINAWVRAGALPPDGRTQFMALLELTPAEMDAQVYGRRSGEDQTRGSFSVSIDYTDASGGQLTTVTLDFVNQGSWQARDWRASRASYRREGSEEPFAEVEFPV